MVTFPNAKINLGLNILRKRPEGFHDLNTIFYPVRWCDALEVIEGGSKPFDYSSSGLDIDVQPEKNILYKAWALVTKSHNLPPLKVHLHKAIPMGAGLGGGSANAAFFLKQLNSQFNLEIKEAQLEKMAAELGSDCAFFIRNTPCFAEGRGEVLSPIGIDLSRYFILLVFPGIHSTTAEAFSKTVPAMPMHNLKEVVGKLTVEEWRGKLENDFEHSIFALYPEIKNLKDDLYASGALYASLSGSGSTVYGIFDKEPDYQKKAGQSMLLQRPTGFFG